MKIGFVTGTIGCGGAERQLSYLLKGLRNRGYKVCVVSLSDDDLHYKNEFCQYGEVFVCRSSFSKLKKSLCIKNFFARHKPDIVHCFSWYTAVYYPFIRQAGVPCVIGGERSLIKKETPLAICFRHVLYRLVNKVVVNSRAAFLEILDLKLPYRKVRIVNNGISLPGNTEELNPLPEDFPRPFIFAIGSLWWYRGLPRLLKAVAQLKVKGIQVSAVIAGEGPERENLMCLADKLHITDRLILLGQVGDLRPYLCEASAFCLTSYFEGFPNALGEAMLAGCPCIAMDVGGVRELIASSEMGWVVPPGDVEAMVAVLKKILSDPSKAKQNQGHKAAGWIRKNFTIDKMVTHMFEVYKEATEK